MAWEWSHTHEAYRDAELNLRALPHDVLACIAAEWDASNTGEDGSETGFDEKAYDLALPKRTGQDSETLANTIWDKASNQASCTNGGHYAYMCPFGCGPHMVGFDREKEGQDNKSE